MGGPSYEETGATLTGAADGADDGTGANWFRSLRNRVTGTINVQGSPSNGTVSATYIEPR